MPLMYSKPTVKNRIVFYLRHRPGWISNGELQAQSKFWQTTGSTIARRARELADEGKIQRRITKGLVEYRYD